MRRMTAFAVALSTMFAMAQPKAEDMKPKLDDYSALMQARAEAMKWADCMRLWGQVGNRERFDRCAKRFDDAAALIAELEGRGVAKDKQWSEP